MQFRSFAILTLTVVGCIWIIYGGLGLRLPEPDLRFANDSEPQTLDPAIMTGVPEGRLSRALFEGLTTPNLRDLTKPLPGAAMHWEVSSDGKTYTFYIRENARWSNGKPVTADNFLFSWRRLLTPSVGSQYAELLWSLHHGRAYNQQLFYLAKDKLSLRQFPDSDAPVQTFDKVQAKTNKGTSRPASQPASKSKEKVTQAFPKGTLFVRHDLGKKVIRKRVVQLLDTPEGKPVSGGKLRSGLKAKVLKKQKKGPYTWYLVLYRPSKKRVDAKNVPSSAVKGWVRSDQIFKTHKTVKVKDVQWFEVSLADKPHWRGWVRQKALTQPDYDFLGQQKKKTKSEVKAWKLLGLEVAKVQKPLPKGYQASALGKNLIFKVHLETPVAYFTQLASFYSLMPVYPPLVLKKPRSWVLPRHFVGNGAFKLTHWFINDLIRVEKNPLYWNAKTIRMKSIHFVAVDERDTQLSMYLSGDLDIVTKPPLPTIDILLKRKDFRSRPYLGHYFYRINTRKPPLNNVNLRKALAYAIDRKSIVKHILRAGQKPSHGHVPPGIGTYPPFGPSGPHFDPKKARAFLRKAGFKKGDKLPELSLLYNTDQQHKQVAEAIQKMWNKHLGLKINLLNKEWKTYLDAVKQGEYQIARAGWIGDYTDPNTFLGMFVTGGGHNRTGWSNSQYDSYIRQAEFETNEKKRFGIFRKAEGLLVDEVPIIPLYYYNYQNLINPAIRGHVDNPLNNFDFKLLWRAKEKR